MLKRFAEAVTECLNHTTNLGIRRQGTGFRGSLVGSRTRSRCGAEAGIQLKGAKPGNHPLGGANHSNFP